MKSLAFRGLIAKITRIRGLKFAFRVFFGAKTVLRCAGERLYYNEKRPYRKMKYLYRKKKRQLGKATQRYSKQKRPYYKQRRPYYKQRRPYYVGIRT